MSKNGKKLLNESAIRRFMKLAEIDTLSDQFVGSLSEKYDEDLEEGVYARGDDELGEGPEFDMAGEPDPEAELPPEPEDLEVAEEEGGEVTISDEEATVLTSVLEKLLAAQGEEPDAEEAPPEDLDVEPEEEELPGVGLEEEQEFSEDGMVAEIARRVTTRLAKESRNEKVADVLAERIISRLEEDPRK